MTITMSVLRFPKYAPKSFPDTKASNAGCLDQRSYFQRKLISRRFKSESYT